MRVRIDVSIFATENQAYGNASGAIELAELPHAGDRVTFATSGGGAVPESMLGSLEVEWRRFGIGESAACTIGLEDVVAGSRDEAERVLQFLERAHGLMAERYDSDVGC